MRALVLAGVICLSPATPAVAQAMDHSMHDMPGMEMPIEPAPANPAPDPHAGHDMPSMADKAAPTTATAPTGADRKPGNASAPAPVDGLAAARYWGLDAMERASRDLRREHGGMTYRQVRFTLAELQARDGRDGYRWNGQASIGGDLDRFVLTSEGDGTFGEGIDHAEAQALYSRALDPYWNLQAGVRHDFASRARTYATIGVEGLAPYWFEVEAALFVSDRGDVLGRGEVWYDQRITRTLILQPRAEFNFSAQDVSRDRLGSGLTDAELGLRLRYEARRDFAPYLGLSWERRFGDTARYSRAAANDTGGFAVVLGIATAL